MSRNNVRGPTSALTEFLREQGITARTIVQRGRRAEEAENAAAGPSTAPDAMDGKKNGYASDALDDSEEEAIPAGKKRKLGKAALEKMKAKEKKTAKKKKKGSDDDYSEDDDIYTALSKGAFSGAGKGSAVPPAGTFENCAKCGKKFTVTRYTMAAIPGPGFLCHPCAKAFGADPFKKPAMPRKRKDPAERRKIISFEDIERVKSLAAMCIEVIGKHIEDVEALGDIGMFNMDKIAQVIAKNRSLTSQNSQLFYDIRNTSLTLYDATNLQPDALCALASLNPNLESLRLDFCGRITDDALLHWSSHLQNLKRIELLGPFLVRIAGWISFIEKTGPQLVGFLINQSPRFDLDCITALVTHARQLTELRLAEVGKLADDWIPHIATLSNLTSLELSNPTHSLSDEAVVQLLEAVGSGLTHLNLSGNEGITDTSLLDGILPNMTKLASLVLSNLPLVTDQGFAELFNSWTANPPLEVLDLSRNHLPASAALSAVATHSAQSLTHLSINGWKGASKEALLELGEKTTHLIKIDFGWCRGADDFLIKALLEAAPGLQEIKCYGCNRVTIDCPRKSTVRIIGVEGHKLG
ncbi:RNI-like protein [Hysterangium stoloniferum]|nr:RNI-like protein [Hysterangium stoloniferum]